MELRRNEERTEETVVSFRARSSDIAIAIAPRRFVRGVANAAWSRTRDLHPSRFTRFPFFPLPIYRGMMNRHSQPRASSQRYILSRATRINSAVNCSAVHAAITARNPRTG